MTLEQIAIRCTFRVLEEVGIDARQMDPEKRERITACIMRYIRIAAAKSEEEKDPEYYNHVDISLCNFGGSTSSEKERARQAFGQKVETR